MTPQTNSGWLFLRVGAKEIRNCADDPDHEELGKQQTQFNSCKNVIPQPAIAMRESGVARANYVGNTFYAQWRVKHHSRNDDCHGNQDAPLASIHFLRAAAVSFLAGLCGALCSGLAFASRCSTAVNGTASSSYSERSIGLDFFALFMVFSHG